MLGPILMNYSTVYYGGCTCCRIVAELAMELTIELIAELVVAPLVVVVHSDLAL